MDESAGGSREASFDPKFVVAEFYIHGHLSNGPTLMGNLAKYGMDHESFVRIYPSHNHEEHTNGCGSYQQIQQLSPLQTAIRYLPNIIAGSTLNVLTGLLVHRIPGNYYVVIISAICTTSPLLMAFVDPAWSWWWCTFWVMLFLPISVDGSYPQSFCIRGHLVLTYSP